MNTALATKALNYVAVSSALTKKALDELDSLRQAHEKAAACKADVLSRMLEVGAAAGHQKQAAEAMLGSHAETLGLFKMALDKIAKMQAMLQKSAVDFGEGVDEKEAGVRSHNASGYDSLGDGYVGRKTSKVTASDLALFRGLGLADPRG